MKYLSVIIPTYNMEKYLHRCLDSLLIKDNFNSLEVWVVNDGSKDSSSDIAHEYETKYPNVFHVLDKPNGNYGSCVNAALPLCTGKYMRLLDADDWFDTNSLEIFLRKLSELQENVDVIYTNYQKVYLSKKKSDVYKLSPKLYNKIFHLDDQDLYDIRPSLDISMHHITYRTQLLKDIGYRQLEGISYTDTEYDYYPMIKAKNFIFYDLVLYQYFIGRADQTVSLENRAKHINDIMQICERMINETTISNTKSMAYLQHGFILYTFSCFYHVALVCQKLTTENEVKLQKIEALLKNFNNDIYNGLGNIRCLGIPYIKLWRTRGIQIIPAGLYRFLFKLFR